MSTQTDVITDFLDVERVRLFTQIGYEPDEIVGKIAGLCGTEYDTAQIEATIAKYKLNEPSESDIIICGHRITLKGDVDED